MYDANQQFQFSRHTRMYPYPSQVALEYLVSLHPEIHELSMKTVYWTYIELITSLCFFVGILGGEKGGSIFYSSTSKLFWHQ